MPPANIFKTFLMCRRHSVASGLELQHRTVSRRTLGGRLKYRVDSRSVEAFCSPPVLVKLSSLLLFSSSGGACVEVNQGSILLLQF